MIFIDYDYRDVLEPLVHYICHANNVEFADQLTTVVIPEFIWPSLPAQLLHNQTANILRMRLRTEEDLVIIDVPYLIKSPSNTTAVGDAAEANGDHHTQPKAQERSNREFFEHAKTASGNSEKGNAQLSEQRRVECSEEKILE